MPNPHRGEVTLKLGDKVYPIRVSLNTLADAQDILDERDFNAIMRRLQPDEQTGEARADFIVMRALLCACLREQIPGIDARAAGAMVPPSEITTVMEAISKALNLAFAPAGKEDGAGESPPPPAAAETPAGQIGLN